jgi:glycosyltransferase involved in cell wall biosynthesis
MDLAPARSAAEAVLGLPANVIRLWRAIGRTAIVHTAVAGWPVPIGWIAAPLARLRGRFLLIIVESAPWRVPPGAGPGAGLRRRVRAVVSERMARWCVALADVAIYTHAQYRASLPPRDPGRGHVIPASWIDDRVILGSAEADALWRDRLAVPDAPLALVFAGRLTADKGVLVLLEALKVLDAEGVRVALDLFGAGDLEEHCRRIAADLRGPAALRLRGTLPYDEGFFRALRPYHALLAPSLSDEQPRIVYDAFSQALPVLASDTAGLRECIAPEVNGRLVPPGDASALAATIRHAATHRDELRRLGLAALASARALTHREMHRRRCRILREALAARR